MPRSSVSSALSEFLNVVASRLGLGTGQPEAQLSGVDGLLSIFGASLGRLVEVTPETGVAELHIRPDMAVHVERLLSGFLELKAPGKGADPSRFTDQHDRDQWQSLRELPNLIYTDGWDWALYRAGERVASVSLGPVGTVRTDHRALLRLVEIFLAWEPIVPSSPEALAAVLAPLCRILRDEVAAALRLEGSAMQQLAADWRQVLFPEASDDQFADAYAQTLTYALLLARLDPSTEGGAVLTAGAAAETLQTGHALLAQALRILTDPAARAEIATGVSLLERAIGAVQPDLVRGRAEHDVWLYFYEQFLAEYDPRLREERGVYYTPVPVVHTQVRLVSRLLQERLGKDHSFAEEGVVLLDPAVGTGTYPLAAIDHALELCAETAGTGAIPGRATQLARNVHAFEILVGPYTVAHLRLTQRIRDAGGQLPPEGAQVYLTDTLESPEGEPQQIPLFLRRLGDEHERARRVKLGTRVLVCIGNPPYHRQSASVRSGGGEGGHAAELLGRFLDLARGHTMFSHIASLYNDYVYFWRWAISKVFESDTGPGIVSFISASSYLSGPGFIGMREVLRREADEIWIIDLEGGGIRASENVFAILTPVAIAIAVRYGDGSPEMPASVHYARVEGTREEKLQFLEEVAAFGDIEWRLAPDGWTDPFVAQESSVFGDWPLLADIFPWQTPGMMIGRTWPVATSRQLAEERWRRFAASSVGQRPELLREGRFGRRVVSELGTPTWPPPASPGTLAQISHESVVPQVVPYGYRSLLKNWILADARLIDLQRPPMWYATRTSRSTWLAS